MPPHESLAESSPCPVASSHRAGRSPLFTSPADGHLATPGAGCQAVIDILVLVCLWTRLHLGVQKYPGADQPSQSAGPCAAL